MLAFILHIEKMRINLLNSFRVRGQPGAMTQICVTLASVPIKF